jgi:hypothetical protein
MVGTMMLARRVAGQRASALVLTLALAAGAILWHWSTA